MREIVNEGLNTTNELSTGTIHIKYSLIKLETCVCVHIQYPHDSACGSSCV